MTVPGGRRWGADLALIAAVAIWGATFVVVKNAIRDASTLLFLALRFSLASVVLAAVYAPRYRHLRAIRRSLWAGVLAGMCLFGGFLFQTVGLRYTTPSKSAFLTALAIVAVPLLVLLVNRSVPRPSEVAGIVLATIGLGLMTLKPGNWTLNRGDVLTVVCALGFALHIMVLAHFSSSTSLELLSLSQVFTAALIALSTFWWAETPRVHWTPGLTAALVVTGVFATALAFTVQAWAQRHISPARTALILALEPIFALATSLAVAAEKLSLRGAAGGMLILGGVLLAELKPALVWKHPLK